MNDSHQVPKRLPPKPAVSTSAGGMGGGRHQPPRLAAASSPPPPNKTLTPIFNKAARPPNEKKASVSKVQIERLKKKLSSPKLTLDYAPKGTVTNSYDPKADRRIMEAIKIMTAKLEAKRTQAQADFSKATLKGTLKPAFNRAARRGR